VGWNTENPSGLPEKRSASDYLDLYDVTFLAKPAGIEIWGTSHCQRAIPSKIMKSHESMLHTGLTVLVVIDLLIDQPEKG